MIKPFFGRGEAAFTADDAEFLIVLDVTGWMAAERSAGTSLIGMLSRIHAALEAGEEPTLADLAAILHGGLQREHPGLSLEDAVNLLMADYTRVSAALNDAIVASLPTGDDDASEGEAGNEPAPAEVSGTGNSSSHSGAARGKTPKRSGGKRRG